MAPEIVKKRDYYGGDVDVWALGVMLYRVLTGLYPFRAKRGRELYRKIYQGSYDESILPSESSKNLIRKMLAVRPSDRSSMEDVLQHEWFKQNLCPPIR